MHRLMEQGTMRSHRRGKQCARALTGVGMSEAGYWERESVPVDTGHNGFGLEFCVVVGCTPSDNPARRDTMINLGKQSARPPKSVTLLGR